MFAGRLRHYCDLKWILLRPSVQVGPAGAQDESQRLIKHLNNDDTVILLDERGKSISSTWLAESIEYRQNHSVKRLVLIIGGAYGVSPAMRSRADECISLGSLVLPHQLVRLILAEQLYRAFTIINNEPYHHS